MGVVMVMWPIQILSPPMISPERLKLDIFSIGITNCPLNGRGHGHVMSLNFWK